MQESKAPWIVGIVVGVMLTLAPLCGVLGTVLGLVRLFEAVAVVEASRKAEMLSTGISHSMWSTAIGFAIFPVGLVILSLSIYKVATISQRAKRDR